MDGDHSPSARRASGHEGHAHAHGPPTNDERRLLWALALTGSFMIAEVVGGVLSGSLALIADAGHMLTDTGALALAWYAARVARRPATPLRSYGHHRFQVLAAFVNGASLIGIAVWILIEAVRRLIEPVEILGGMMAIVAALGLLVNIVAILVLHGGSETNLNIRGAVLHVAGDLLGSVAALVAAGVIMTTGWVLADPLLSVLVAFLVLRGAWDIASRSWHVLMEGTPEDLDIAEIEAVSRTSVPGLLDLHHIHLWALTPERPLMTCHARIAADADHDEVRERLQSVLRDNFGLRHTTIQTERGPCGNADPSGLASGDPRAGRIHGIG